MIASAPPSFDHIPQHDSHDSGHPLRLRSRRGDVVLLDSALEMLRPRMTAVARGVVRNPDAAEDVVQNAYVKAIRGLAGFDGRAKLSTWLHRIVVNEGLMWLRSEGRRRKRFQLASDSGIDPDLHGDPDCDPSQPLLDREQLQRLRSALADLPAAEREVLERCALGGQSYDDYGQEIGIGAAAAKSRAFRARRRLREVLGRD